MKNAIKSWHAISGIVKTAPLAEVERMLRNEVSTFNRPYIVARLVSACGSKYKTELIKKLTKLCWKKK